MPRRETSRDWPKGFGDMQEDYIYSPGGNFIFMHLNFVYKNIKFKAFGGFWKRHLKDLGHFKGHYKLKLFIKKRKTKMEVKQRGSSRLT